MAPNQEPTVNRLVCSPLLNLLPEPYFGVGKNFNEKFAPKFAHPVGKVRAKICTKNPLHTLDGRNRAIVVVESLARVIAAIRVTSVRWRSHFALKTQN